MKKEDVLVVYWGIFTSEDRQTKMNLMWGPPAKLIDTLPEKNSTIEGSYKACTGAKNMFTKTYVISHPISATVSISGNYDSPNVNSTFNAFVSRPASFKEQYSVDYDFSWLFFSEESVIMKQTPPYLHGTSEKSSATLATAEYDISKWFRPVNPCYLLWKGVTSFTVTKDDPAFYLEFQTTKKVVLKHFEVTSEISQLATEVTSHKNLFPKESLSTLYSRFTRSHRDKRLIKLIKDNLLE
jgi:hypothetical protein